MDPLNILRFGSGLGAAAPIFLIHGYTGDARRWALIEEPLVAHHPMIAVEMPNHGDSPKRPVAGFAGLLDEVHAAFRALGLTRAHLVGHSLGGGVAMGLAKRLGGVCASLTLLAPAGLGTPAAAATLKGLATATAAEDLRRFYKCLVHDPALVTDEWVDLAVGLRADRALRDAQDQMGQALFPAGHPSFDLRGTLARLTVPTQIIWGKEDQILPWEGALAAPGPVALHLFEGMGHIPQLEAPAQTAALILRHIRASA